MSLSIGTRLGSFETPGLLGVCGMGEVYRVRAIANVLQKKTLGQSAT